MKKGLLNRLLGILLISYCTFIIINIAIHKEVNQWDLYRYYACAKAYESGINPYDSKAVSQMETKPVIAFTNPPIVLFIFRNFTKVNFNFLFYLYLIFKCLLLFGLIYLWRNMFLNKQVDMLFYLLCLFGFNSAIYLDLRAGNITILEQLIIWLAFSCYLKRKFIYFCACIIVASIFKIQPILFILLLIFTNERSKYRLIIGSFVVFGAIIFMQYIYDPRIFSYFVSGFVNYTGVERQIINPSTSAFLRDMVDIFLETKDPVMSNIISTSLYFIVIIPIIFISRLAYIRIKSAKIEDKEKWVIFLGCLIYALTANYFKDFSYILLILPTYFIIKTTRIGPKILLLFIASISAANVTLPSARYVVFFLWNYYPLFVAYFVWFLYLYELYYLEQSELSQ